MSVLMGPADADHFRVKVGRYGDRWYTDPLEGCDIADASEWTGPSISTVKKAASNDWSYVAMSRCARDIVAHPDKYNGEQAAVYEQLKIANKVGLDIDAGRGTIIHLWCEDLLHGRPMREFNEWDLAATKLSTESLTIALAYKSAIQHWFDVYQPELVAVEFVCIDRELNGVGYGGTGDCIVKIGGHNYLVDWKSRGPSSDHGAYPEEGAQIAALSGSGYMIVTGPDGEAARRLHGPIDAGLVVSIKPEGCRSYPIDLAKAYAHWTALHAWWCARRDEREAIGRSWPARSAASSTTADVDTDDWRAEARRRYSSWSEAEQLAYTDRKADIDTADREAVFALMNEIDAFNVTCELVTPTPPVHVEPPQPPDEGSTVTDADVKALRERFDCLDEAAQMWTGALVAQGKAAFPWRITDGTPTVRRYELYRGVLALAEWSGGDIDEVVRAVVRLVTDDETALWPTRSPGALLASLGAGQAAKFAEVAIDLTKDRYSVIVDADRMPRLRVTA